MYIDRNIISEYPYNGQFYRTSVDESLPLNKRKEIRDVFFTTPCDVMKSGHTWSKDFIWAKYAVYFPFDKDKDEVKVKIGDMFECDVYGLIVNGKVIGVFPSEMGGVLVYIQDTDA